MHGGQDAKNLLLMQIFTFTFIKYTCTLDKRLSNLGKDHCKCYAIQRCVTKVISSFLFGNSMYWLHMHYICRQMQRYGYAQCNGCIYLYRLCFVTPSTSITLHISHPPYQLLAVPLALAFMSFIYGHLAMSITLDTLYQLTPPPIDLPTHCKLSILTHQ